MIENGIEIAKVFLSSTLFERAYRAADEGNEKELKRILAGQYRSTPQPDPMDIIEVSWAKAPPKLRQAVSHDLSVVATIEIARGHRILADYVRRHVDGGVKITRKPGEDMVTIFGDGGEIKLDRRSLRRHSWEEGDGTT